MSGEHICFPFIMSETLHINTLCVNCAMEKKNNKPICCFSAWRQESSDRVCRRRDGEVYTWFDKVRKKREI